MFIVLQIFYATHAVLKIGGYFLISFPEPTCLLVSTKTRSSGIINIPETRGAFHLVKNSENSGSGLNGKRLFGLPGWKIPRKSGTA